MTGSQGKKKIAAVAVILSCFVCAPFAVDTVADDIAFLSPIVGSNPGVTIAGVQSGAAPWLVNHGFAVVNDEGRLPADLRGLILQNPGTPGPSQRLPQALNAETQWLRPRQNTMLTGTFPERAPLVKR